MEKTIRFQDNWNKKLCCNYFTTLRLHNPVKYKAGNQHKLLLQEAGIWRDYGMVEVVSVRVVRMHQLNEFICGLDFGASIDDSKDILFKMYREKVPDINKAEFALVLYKKLKSQPSQNSIFQ